MKSMKSTKSFIPIIIIVMPISSIQSQQDLEALGVVKKADDNMRGNTSQADIAVRIIRPS